jgi:hypothetical protein
MWKRIVVTAGIAVLASIAVVGVFRCERSSYRLERSATIAAPPEAVQARIADLQQWTTWSPWERPDADLDRKFEGPDSGAGASYSWSGGDEVGAGRLTVVSASPGQVHVLSQIERPRRRASDFKFTIAAEGKGTRVTWAASCENDRASLGDLLMGPSPASEADLERGLARLKSAAEAAALVETYRFERSAKIEAAAGVVQRHLANLRDWTDWTPREALDRGMHEQFAGRPMGAGSTYYWSGNDAVGSGRVTLVSVSPARVELEVKVDEPAPSVSDLEFALTPEGEGTRVAWTVTGEKDASGKAFGLFAIPADDLDGDMEKALSRLKALIEAETRLAAN